jgi:hypothetical protein
MIKKKFTLKGSIILIILILVSTTLTFSKVKVNIDGSVNINFGKKSSNNNNNDNSIIIWDDNNNHQYNVGDITDSYYNLKPFILNDKGYAVIRDRGNLYILQVTFYNGDISRVKKEQLFNAHTYSSNCLAIAGDSNYCLTITPKGYPALWDRNKGRIKYTGRWLKNNYSYDYYDNNYYDSNQSWFEW